MKELNRKLNEFCEEGKLWEFREVLLAIFTNIENANCRICARYDSGPSIHEFSSKDNTCLIRIPIKRFNKPIEIIWTILHEFGHHMSGHIELKELTNKVRLCREKEAWDYARKQVLSIEELKGGIEEFELYADSCYKSYEQKFKNDL